MNVINFVAKIAQDSSFIESSQSILFLGKEYPLLFISSFVTHIQQLSNLSVCTLDVTQIELSALKGQLETSFLGQKRIYVLHGLHVLDVKKQKEFVSYIVNNQSEHTIFFYMNQGFSDDRTLTVTLPDSISKKDFIALAHASNLESVASNFLFINHIFSRTQTISLDQTFLLFEYGKLLGGNTQAFCTQWLDHIITGHHSLFSLSQHFFGKNERDFFKLWHKVHELYSLPFWVAYWSEQLFRASAFITLHSNNQIAHAKKIGYRLPFSFLQKDWKKYTPQELKNAHNYIYSIDYDFKNGSQVPRLDLFFSSFFLGQFK